MWPPWWLEQHGAARVRVAPHSGLRTGLHVPERGACRSLCHGMESTAPSPVMSWTCRFIFGSLPLLRHGEGISLSGDDLWREKHGQVSQEKDLTEAGEGWPPGEPPAAALALRASRGQGPAPPLPGLGFPRLAGVGSAFSSFSVFVSVSPCPARDSGLSLRLPGEPSGTSLPAGLRVLVPTAASPPPSFTSVFGAVPLVPACDC